MLAIEVEYLTGRVYAGVGRGPAVEWPPHPARLFAALTSACHELNFGEKARNALHWLERQPAPAIQAPDRGDSAIGLAFVPANYVAENGSPLLEHRKKQPRYFPSLSPHPPLVYFIWPEAAPDGETRRQIDLLARQVGYFGKAASLVRMCVVEDAPEANYVPDNMGGYSVRVPSRGVLDLLERRHEMNRWEPSELPMQRYARVAERAMGSAAGPFSELVVLRRAGGGALNAEGTVTLTDALRRAALSVADAHGLMTPLLHGHDDGPHCGYWALPFAGSEHADGRVMGLAIAIPRVAAPADKRKVRAVASLLEELALPEPLRAWKLEPADANVHGWTLRSETWSRESRIWSSVTPVLLDRFPKAKLSAEEIIAQSCERLGLPRPVEIEHGPYSRLEGVAPVPAFRLLRKAGERPRWGVHVRLRFDRMVGGPLALGAGRFFGLGLLRPVAEER